MLSAELGRPVVSLDESPDHHIGMFMNVAGNNVMLVGDPNLGKQYSSDRIDLPEGPDFSAATQRQFDAVAEQVASLGYRVVRIPTLLSPDQRTYLTYVNGLTEWKDGKRIVYMPSYRGAESLNAAAAAVWQTLGYEVHPIDCTSAYRHFGTLHCLVNVLRRDAR
jgi:hypothetical protein